MEFNNKIVEYFSDIFSILDERVSLGKLLMTDDFCWDDFRDWLDEEVFKDKDGRWDWPDCLTCNDINFYFNAGETKMVITVDDYRDYISEKFDQNFVIKIPFGNTYYNYCDKEKVFSSILIEEYPDIKDLFALCYSLFKRYDTDIYVMERATVDDLEEKGASRLIESDRKFLERKGYNEKEINEIISRNYSRYYSPGESTVKEILQVSYPSRIYGLLEDFLGTFKINDIHRGNIGFINNNPVIIDYSGYYE